ncbi:hypothetical protein PYCCODRAFT_841281 [Trametes coccinea BRFM310]|uniref:Uncharacterized protein n=1 Tax=Trametes coccinea (strain BRFM310) TaxID=1353009 RepID=A0A1Y2IE66_TRAC3|nr:hypothetical protein PYCCODRAFT_841281 [Trametes coccinea BRFM310]
MLGLSGNECEVGFSASPPSLPPWLLFSITLWQLSSPLLSSRRFPPSSAPLHPRHSPSVKSTTSTSQYPPPSPPRHPTLPSVS